MDGQQYQFLLREDQGLVYPDAAFVLDRIEAFVGSLPRN